MQNQILNQPNNYLMKLVNIKTISNGSFMDKTLVNHINLMRIDSDYLTRKKSNNKTIVA